ncbi:ATP-binding protein [Flavobacterium sp. NRK F10]|uniref:PAS domain-containing sensor histidine kinase n=1 Tax=Flavobacterium sp. NRK F10 TaxID=2954931 RepID=UPI00209178D8|nr:PAS domain-containing sensor histidine kinase [Flavobacterium sp. NRK F10]MCO6174181.1 ATP-binding protein [Flavobacterium sp. NRK F10]
MGNLKICYWEFDFLKRRTDSLHTSKDLSLFFGHDELTAFHNPLSLFYNEIEPDSKKWLLSNLKKLHYDAIPFDILIKLKNPKLKWLRITGEADESIKNKKNNSNKISGIIEIVDHIANANYAKEKIKHLLGPPSSSKKIELNAESALPSDSSPDFSSLLNDILDNYVYINHSMFSAFCKKKILASNEYIWYFDGSSAFLSKGLHKALGIKSIHNLYDLKKIIHPDDFNSLFHSLKSHFKSSSSTGWKTEYRIRKNNDSYIPIMDKAIILNKSDDNSPMIVIGIMSSLNRITKEKERIKDTNKNLKMQLQNLVVINKELEQFAYHASHDLQEPLRNITNILNLLESDFGDNLDKQGKKYIEFAQLSAFRMRNLVKAILEFSRLGNYQPKKETVDCNELVQDITEILHQKIASKNASINCHNLPVIESYLLALTQIFQNLIDNALKYSKKDVAPVITINYEEKPEYHEFSVADNGIGIEEQYLEKIFMMFQRLHTRSEYEGTGLGLAAVKKVLTKINGKIWVKSTVGKGSTFYFSINK